MNDTPVAGNSQLAVSLDNATGLRSVSFTLTYDPTLLQVTTAAPAAALTAAGWTVNVLTNVPGTLTVSAGGTTPLSGANLPLVLLAASVPNAAPYGALEALRLTNVAASVQSGAATTSAPITGDYAVHKNAYLGDVDGSGIYTAFDAALIARVAVGIDTTGGAVGGFDAASWTDPVIVGDADGDGKLTGADASLVAQKSVHLPTPQIPDLPGIPLTPNGGGGSLAWDDLAPQTASAQANSAPPAAVGVLVEASSVIVTAPVVNTARPFVPAHSASLTSTLLTTSPTEDHLVAVTPVTWSAPADAARHFPASADLTPTGAAVTQATAATSTVAAVADNFFSQLADDPAADERSLPLAGDSAIDDYYAQLAPTSDSQVDET